jgi:hypothetical protein
MYSFNCVPEPKNRVYNRLWCNRVYYGTRPSNHHYTITTPSLHHHYTITTPSLHHCNTTTIPSQHHHHTTTTPLPLGVLVVILSVGSPAFSILLQRRFIHFVGTSLPLQLIEVRVADVQLSSQSAGEGEEVVDVICSCRRDWVSG